ncbi:hypothetical protein [Mycobacterium canetti]|uniref:hypothetical protein n=1 Tax=Mycobacterium canetti TaxID=78331 RepID=UPI00034B0B64|nr:hypothetical protein [Mycobacterium canetti]
MTTPNTETTPVDETEVSDTESPTPEGEVQDEPHTETEEPDTFPRSYVEELRQENGRYRQRAQQADQYAQRLHTELVRATGRLADPTDLPFDAEHLDDPDKLTAAIDDLLARKPHLTNRRPIGDIGQGATPSGSTVDLAAILRRSAG